MGTAGLPEMDEAAAGHPESLELEPEQGLEQVQEPGRKVVGSSETVAVAAAVVAEGGRAEGLLVEHCIQSTACHTAAVVGRLAAGAGNHLEPGTAGTPDHPCLLGVPAVLQDRGPEVVGVLLAEGLQTRRS